MVITLTFKFLVDFEVQLLWYKLRLSNSLVDGGSVKGQRGHFPKYVAVHHTRVTTAAAAPTPWLLMLTSVTWWGREKGESMFIWGFNEWRCCLLSYQQYIISFKKNPGNSKLYQFPHPPYLKYSCLWVNNELERNLQWIYPLKYGSCIAHPVIVQEIIYQQHPL